LEKKKTPEKMALATLIASQIVQLSGSDFIVSLEDRAGITTVLALNVRTRESWQSTAETLGAARSTLQRKDQFTFEGLTVRAMGFDGAQLQGGRAYEAALTFSSPLLFFDIKEKMDATSTSRFVRLVVLVFQFLFNFP